MADKVNFVTYGLSEYIDLLNRVIKKLHEYKADRDVQIEEYLNDNERHAKLFPVFQKEYYEYCKDYDLESDVLRFRLRQREFNCHLTVKKTEETLPDTVKTYTIQLPIKQSWWDELIDRPVQYFDSVCTDVIKGETVTYYESLEDFWIRLDDKLNTQSFDRVADRMLFYNSNIIRDWHKEDYHRKTHNKFVRMIKNIESILLRVTSSPDATFSIDLKTFDLYTAIITETYDASDQFYWWE